MSKIAFILYFTKENRYSFNALLGALESAGLHNFIDVVIYDPKKKNDSDIEMAILKYEKLVFAFSFFTPQIWSIYEELSTIKNKFGNRIIYLAGGPHPNGKPKSTLEMGFDYVLHGEGEEIIIEFFKAILSNDDISKIQGVHYMNSQGEYLFSERKNIVSLDDFLPYSEYYRKFGPIEITRGCPFACHFCQTTSMFGTNVRHRSLDAINECLKIMARNNLKDFRAITPNAFAYGSVDGKQVNLDQIYNLLHLIKNKLPQGRIYLGSFPSEVRPEHVTDESMRLLCEFVDNDNIILGAQTGSQRLLDLVHRGHTIEDVYNAVALSVKYNKVPNVDFMFGMPGEQMEDIEMSIQVMNDLIKMGAKIHAHTFMPLPQTPFARQGRGKINDNIRMYIRKNTGRGVIYGDWAEQAKLSRKMDYLLKTDKIVFD